MEAMNDLATTDKWQFPTAQMTERLLIGRLDPCAGRGSLVAGHASRLVSEVVGQRHRDVQLAEGMRAGSQLQEPSQCQPGQRHQGLGLSCVGRGRRNETPTFTTRSHAPPNPGEGTATDRNTAAVLGRVTLCIRPQRALHGSWAH